MGTENETEVDDDGRGLDEGGDEQVRAVFTRFVGGVWSGEEVESEGVEGDVTPVKWVTSITITYLLNSCSHGGKMHT